MAKGKGKNSRDSLAPPKPPSLRSKKRECPSDEMSNTDDVQATLHHQDTPLNQSPLQVSTGIAAQKHQAGKDSCLTKQEPSKEEHAETNATVFEGQEETTVTNTNNNTQLEGFRVHTDKDANNSGKDKEVVTAEECHRSPSQTDTDQLQVLLPTTEDGDGSCATALEEKLGAKENSQCNLERNQETSHEERSSMSMSDVKEVTKEAVVRLPAKKKRRMGMCGLTEKERSNFLQTQKRENGQNGPERAEKQICITTTDFVAQEEMISSPPLPSSLSIPAGSVTEQNEAEIKLQSRHCGGDDRTDTEDYIAVITSDGTSTECDPGCSKVNSCETEEGIVPGPEQTGDTKSDAPADEELLGDQEQQKLEGHASMTEKPQEQIIDWGNGSTVVDRSLAISFYSNPTQNEKTEDQDAIEAAPLMDNVNRTRDEKKEELTCDAGEGDRAATWSGGFNCGSVDLCQTVVSPGGSERKDNTRNTTDLFGTGSLDYVSDSQLNTITLIEEEVVEREEDLGPPDCQDATDLICGLIRELSSLNRTVMATHRELESLRGSSKSSRSSTH